MRSLNAWKLLAILSVSATLGACASNKPQMAGMYVSDKGLVPDGTKVEEVKDLRTTFVAWNADANVAMFDAHGQGCFQPAIAMKGKSIENDFQATLTKLLGDGSGISDKTKLAETIQLLSNKDVSVTFLDTALAGICLIAMNQTNNYVKESALKKADLADVIKHAINVASSIALAQAEVQKAMYQAKTVEGTGGDKQNKSGEEKTAAERKISGQTVAATK